MVFRKGHKTNIGRIPWNKGLKGFRTIGSFKKGATSLFKGKHHSDESKKKNSLANLGKHNSPRTEFKKGNIPMAGFKKGHLSWMKGKKRSEELNKKQSESMKGKIPWNKGKTNIYSKETIKRIKESRAKQIFPIQDTSIEIKIQNFLKQLNIEFYAHEYINEIKHAYQCDIFIPSKNMVIECDGNYWHSYPTGRKIDYIRMKELLEKGFKVLRLWESEINKMDIKEFRELIKRK